jgi:hypothetical protein
MIKKFTVLFILLLMVGSLKSQTIAGDTISIGGFNARINCIGNHFYDFAGNRYFEIPKGSSLQTLFNSALWVGGMDNMNMMHFAG